MHRSTAGVQRDCDHTHTHTHTHGTSSNPGLFRLPCRQNIPEDRISHLIPEDRIYHRAQWGRPSTKEVPWAVVGLSG